MFSCTCLAERRRSMYETLFKQIARESNVMHYLLPEERDSELTSRMRSMNKIHLQTVIRTLLYYTHSLTSSTIYMNDWTQICLM